VTELPEGWVATPVSSFSTKIGSGATPRGGAEVYVEAGVPLIRSQNVHFDGFKDEGLVRLTPSQAAALDGVKVQRRDVLLNITGASIGRVCVAPDRMDGARVNQHVAILRTVEDAVIPEFVALFLRSPELQDRIQSEEYGVTRQALTKAWICDLEVPLPPFSEQHRIVDIAEALLADVNAALARLAKVPGILKRFRQSVLAAAYAGRLTEDWRERGPTSHADNATRSHRNEADADDLPDADLPDSWSWVRTEALCEPTRSITYGVIKLGSAVQGGVPTLRSSDVRPLLIDLSSVKKIERRIADQYSRTYLRGREVLVTVRGTLGGVAVADSNLAGYNISREVAQLPLLERLNPRFVMYAIASLASQKWLAERAKGVAYIGINIADLRRLPLPLPPQPEQDEIVRRVDRLLEFIDDVERSVVVGAGRANALTQSILAKTFRGELVPTEGVLARAEALLARIQSERAVRTLRTGDGRRRPARRASVRP
jgi:type I restriction enzyme S subunit